VTAELFHAGGWTDRGGRYDEANNRFLELCERVKMPISKRRHDFVFVKSRFNPSRWGGTKVGDTLYYSMPLQHHKLCTWLAQDRVCSTISTNQKTV